MFRRKIQLIAGTTYSVSLPKDWIRKNGLKEKDEIVIEEQGDRSLVLSSDLKEGKKLKEISLNVEELGENLVQTIFAVYYVGVENITLFSKKPLNGQKRTLIRSTMNYMSGTEIVHEDDTKIIVRVMLDKDRVDLIQTLYRISLLLDLSLGNLLDNASFEDYHLNEEEIDRLFHLMTKIVSLSLINTSVLHSSGVKHASLIPSYFLMAKKMENLGDSAYRLARHLERRKQKLSQKDIVMYVKEELKRGSKHIMQQFPGHYKKSRYPADLIKALSSLKDRETAEYLRDMIRQIGDFSEEIVNISFYMHLIKEKSI
jgi:phosphate transport system protein